MFTIVLGVNPINMSRVERNAANILRAVIEFIPGGGLITQALDSYGVFDKVGAWVEQQIRTLGMTGAVIKEAISRFLDSLSWRDIFDLGGVWSRAKRIFTEPIDRILGFLGGLVAGILNFIREAILRPLARLAEGTRGYDLLKAVLGQDPVTGDPVPRTADTLIGGFMKLIGQEEIWNNLKKANAVARAWAWFQGALGELLAFVRQVPTLIVSAVKSLELIDIVVLPRVFMKVGAVFGGFVADFIGWAGRTVWTLLEIIFEVVAPAVIPYIKKAALKDPIAFVGNLVRAGRQGFEMFARNILEHLKTALIKWLVGPLGDAGVYIPKSFELMEIIKLVLSVLGLTWQNIRSKLVKFIPEPVLVGLEKTFGILVTLVRDGPAAAWEQIKTELNELKGQLIAQVSAMISTEIVKAAVVKLVSMLNPAGAVVQAIIAIYNTVTFFIQKINQIAAVVGSFIDSIAAIAAGQVEGAAKKVEQTMANTLTVIIAFLAKFAGLGNVPEKLVGIVKKIRAPIDKGLDRIVAWLVGMAKSFAAKVKSAVTQWWKARKPVPGPGQEKHTLYMEGEGAGAKLMIQSDPTPYQAFVNTLKTTKDKSAVLKLATACDAAIAVAAKEPAPANAGAAVEQALAALATGTGLLLGKTQLEPTPPIFGGLIGEYGSSATVLRLMPPFKGGSEPSVSSDGWNSLRKRLDGKGTYYVRGHLLNHNLGGPGNTWANLVPLTQFANNRAADSMLKVFEKPIKDAADKGSAINFAVTATYGRKHPLAGEVAGYKKSGDAEMATAGEIIEAEKFVPLSLSCKGSLIDSDTGKVGSVVAQTTVDNVIQDRLDDYFLTGKSKQVFKINSVKPEELQKLYGIGPNTAAAIAAKRPFSSFEDVMKAGNLTAAQWKAARETPRLRVIL
jgi:hypothetical protein